MDQFAIGMGAPTNVLYLPRTNTLEYDLVPLDLRYLYGWYYEY